MARRALLLLAALFSSTLPAHAYDFALEKKNASAIGIGCYDVKTADLNGDGLADAVAAINDGHRIAVMLTTPSGLGAPVYYAGGQAVAVDLADFNGNGSIDILVAEFSESRVRLLLSQGNGTFASVGTFSVPGNARDVASADFNGDGKRDAVVATANGYVTYLPGTGGGFGSPVSLSAGSVLKGIAVGDLDNDGDPDVVAVDPATNKMVRLRNDGGSFPFPIVSETGFSGSPSDVALADFDGDGFLDAAVSQENNVVAVVRGGLADSTGSVLTYPIGSTSQSVQVADFDQEHGPDILVSAWGQSLVQVLRNKGNLVFGSVVQGQTSTHPRAAAPGDFNGDGRIDVVSGDADGGLATLFLSKFAYPHLSYSPASLDFGSGYQGSPTDRAITVQNTGTGTMTVTPGAIDGSEFQYSGPNPVVDIQPGSVAFLVIRCLRTQVGTATGTVHFATNDTLAPDVAVPLTANTVPAYPDASVDPSVLSFGTDYAGTPGVRSFDIYNTGHAVLDVTPGAIDGNQFEYAGSQAQLHIPVASSGTLSIRYLRTTEGYASGTVHLATNDPDTPDLQVPLEGFAGPPPVAGFSAPSPITVSVGANASAKFVVRNLGISPLHINVPDVALDLAEVSPYDLGPTTTEFLRLDQSGAAWNLDWEGRVISGGTGEYFGGMDEANFLVQAGGVLGLGGRELRLGPVAVAPGILVTRKIYAPGTGKWLRYIDVAENPNDTPRTATFDLIDNIGYVPSGPILTSNGDAQFQLTDDWIIVPAPGGTRTVGRMFRGSGASNAPVTATWFATTGAPGSYSRSRYITTLAPHDRACVVQWAIQGADAADAIAIAQQLRNFFVPGLELADLIDRTSAYNLFPLPKPFRPIAGSHTIAPGDSVEISVVYGAEAATHDADVSAILRITTDDPNNRTLAVPLAFSVGNGPVVGVEPPAGSVAAIELAGFRPNPTRLSGTARVAFRLATNEPATLTLYDVRGRTLARETIASPVPGPGSLALSGESLQPGVVWMRLEQGGKIATRKGIVLP